MTVVIDTNIIIDVSEDRQSWREWSLVHLAEALSAGAAIVNDIVFAELSYRYRSAEEVELLLARLELTWRPLSREALFRAGQAYGEYRRRGGSKLNVFSDFLIGAQAVDIGARLLTRDPDLYRAYFPNLDLITP